MTSPEAAASPDSTERTALVVGAPGIALIETLTAQRWRLAGFTGCGSTEKSFVDAFARYRSAGLIP